MVVWSSLKRHKIVHVYFRNTITQNIYNQHYDITKQGNNMDNGGKEGESRLTCNPGKTALLMVVSRSIPNTGSFLKKIMPPRGPRKD